MPLNLPKKYLCWYISAGLLCMYEYTILLICTARFVYNVNGKRRILHPQAAVHGKDLPGDGVGFVRQQEFHHLHNAVGVAEFGYRRFRNDFGTHCFRYFADHAFVHVPRRNAIHGYVIGCQLGGQGSG